MTARRAAVALVAAGLVAVAGWYVIREHVGAAPARAAAPTATPRSSGGRLLAAPRLALAAPMVAHELPASVDEDAVVIDPADVLARVNGIELRLGDLMTVEPGDREPRPVGADALRYLLDRAIDRELVVQAARARGVTLDPAQQAQLADERRQLDSPGPGVISDRTRTPAYVAFDVRDSEGLMLQANLVAASGAPSPHVTTAQVDAYYQAHRADFPPLPTDPAARSAAWTSIDVAIRTQLADAQAEHYRAAVAAFLRDLRTGTGSVVVTY